MADLCADDDVAAGLSRTNLKTCCVCSCLTHTHLWSESRCGLIHEPGWPCVIEFHRGKSRGSPGYMVPFLVATLLKRPPITDIHTSRKWTPPRTHAVWGYTSAPTTMPLWSPQWCTLCDLIVPPQSWYLPRCSQKPCHMGRWSRPRCGVAMVLEENWTSVVSWVIRKNGNIAVTLASLLCVLNSHIW